MNLGMPPGFVLAGFPLRGNATGVLVVAMLQTYDIDFQVQNTISSGPGMRLSASGQGEMIHAPDWYSALAKIKLP